MIDLPAHALAHVEHPPSIFITDYVLTIRAQADIPVAIGRHMAVDRICVGTSGEVLPVVEMHGWLRAVAHQHVAPACVEPIQRSTKILDRLATRRGEVDGTRPRSVGIERNLVNGSRSESVENVGIDWIEPPVRRKRRRTALPTAGRGALERPV